MAASYYEDFRLSRATDRPDGGQSPLQRPTTRPGGRVLHARLEDKGVPIPSLDLASDLSFALSTGPAAKLPGPPRGLAIRRYTPDSAQQLPAVINQALGRQP